MSRQSGPSPLRSLAHHSKNHRTFSPLHRTGGPWRSLVALSPRSEPAPSHGTLPGAVGPLWDRMGYEGRQWFVNRFSWGLTVAATCVDRRTQLARRRACAYGREGRKMRGFEMQMPDVRSMIAIGLSGQLGLNGHLPWEGNKAPEYREDVANF